MAGKNVFFFLNTFIFFGMGLWFGLRTVEAWQLENTESRNEFTQQIRAQLEPNNLQVQSIQQAIYSDRIQLLKQESRQAEQRIKSVQTYMDPLERELREYEKQFNQRTEASIDERLQLYIDLVSTYRDYQKALSSLEDFIPLTDSDSLLSSPSVALDLISYEGGLVAHKHNQFIDQERDSIFASHYEPKFRRFLKDQSLDSYLVECHETLCALHLKATWSNEYYQGFSELWDNLEVEPWMNLNQSASAHEYRGNGVQVQVWYLELP